MPVNGHPGGAERSDGSGGVGSGSAPPYPASQTLHSAYQKAKGVVPGVTLLTVNPFSLCYA